MFSNALKSISATNITGNYSIAQAPTSSAGPWTIYDCKKKSTSKPYSVFVFDKKTLDSHSSSLGRSSASAFRRATAEVIERLKKEASALAKLRHPNILELVEPVEETRGGGLQFVTEAVSASLSSLLQEKDDQERGGGLGGRSSRYVTEDADGVRRRRELEIDELEIQKGLLQISKALEFLHENAGLVHGNLTPDAILVNSKSDWKISGLSFCSPPENSSKPCAIQPISLSEALHLDPRLPRSVQLNLDYSSPDFVIDNNLTTSGDMFSLGLLCIALYNSPHRSPLECSASVSAYKRLFNSSSTVPSSGNRFLSSRDLPRDLAAHLLPRLITRRPAQRMTAKEFQQSEYFDNILISTIRFIDAFPAKTPNEKASFLRGLSKVLSQFPKSVMEKKLLPALLDEMKDKELISLILQNVFKIIDLLPTARRAFGDKVRMSLKDIFVANAKQTQEKDPSKDAGLMVVLENMSTIATNTSGREFKDDILPIIIAAIECPTHAVVDAALRGLPSILPVLDFSTIKNELFPIVAAVFSKTNSLAIKVRGLHSFVVLCGGSTDPTSDDGLDGLQNKKKTSSSTALDKYTMQEKIVPLVKAIKTKEPAVMVATLSVLRVVGDVADAEFVAAEILPILWGMSLGPLLDLKQFQSFMSLIKALSRRVEEEQTKKLQELAGVSNGSAVGPTDDFMSFGAVGSSFDQSNGTDEDDFEKLVKGRLTAPTSSNPLDSGWSVMSSGSVVTSADGVAQPTAQPATFSWSTPKSASPAPPAGQVGAVKTQKLGGFRTVTPDLAQFQSLTPSATQYSQPLQPTTNSQPVQPVQPTNPASSTSINWGTPATSNPWASSSATGTPSYNSKPQPAYGGGWTNSMAGLNVNSQPRPGLSHQSASSFSLPPPPTSNSGTPVLNPQANSAGFSLSPPPAQGQSSMGSFTRFSGGNGMAGMVKGASNAGSGSNKTGIASNGMNSMNGVMGMGIPQQQQQQSKSGLDKYESLI